MTTVSSEKVDSVFQAALEARERGERVDLRALCDGDSQVFSEVEELLQHLSLADGSGDGDTAFLDPQALRGSGGFARRLPGEKMLAPWSGEAVGQRIGDYTVIGELGSGAMGVVFLAEQERPRRTVALKLIRPNIATGTMIARFEREAEMMGRLNHPGMAQIFAAGVADVTTAGGTVTRVPFIAMEYVDGKNILDFCRDSGCDDRTTLHLIAQVCDAIKHAHQRGIIHRDLKPANILITQSEGQSPTAKVLDFGVARLIDDGADARARAIETLTEQGNVIGTLAYMAPEQIRSHDDIDTRCDVYAIGAILYQLLSGKLPIDLKDCPLPEVARRIAEVEPTRLGTIDARFRGDIETIVARALAKDREKRYQSASALSRDLHHYFEGRPIEARRDSLLYLMQRQARRYRTIVLLALAIGLGLAGFAWYAIKLERRQAVARKDAEIARNSAEGAQINAEAARVRADASAVQLADALSASHIEQARLLGDSGELRVAERMLWDEMKSHPDSTALRWALRELYAKSGSLCEVAAHTGINRQGDPLNCRCVRRLPDNSGFVSGGDDGFVTFASLEGKVISRIDTQLGSIRAVAVAPDGTWIVAGSERGAAIFDRATRTLLRKLEPVPGPVQALDVSHNGEYIAEGGAGNDVRIWNAETGNVQLTVRGDAKTAGTNCTALRFSPSGHRLATGFGNGQIRLYTAFLGGDIATVNSEHELAGQATGQRIAALEFSPDDKTLASGSADDTVALWQAFDGQCLATIPMNNGSARSVSFNGDGSLIAVNGYWRVQVIDVATRQILHPPRMPAFGAEGGFDATFCSDAVVSTGASGGVRVWDVKGNQAIVSLNGQTRSSILDLGCIRVGDRVLLAAVQTDGVTVFERPINESSWTKRLSMSPATPCSAVALGRDGRQLLLGTQDGRIVVQSLENGATNASQELSTHQGAVTSIRLTPDGNGFVSTSADGTIAFARRDPSGSWKIIAKQKGEGDVAGVAISADGAVAISIERRGDLRFWKVPTGESLGQAGTNLGGHHPMLSPDGHWLAVAISDRMVELWDARPFFATPGRFENAWPIAGTVGERQKVAAESINADGTLLATVSVDGDVKVWDIRSSDKPGPLRDRPVSNLATLLGQIPDTRAIAFLPAPFDNQLALGCGDGTIRIWDMSRLDQQIAAHAAYQMKK